MDTHGSLQWTFESGRPMISSYYSEQAFEEALPPLIPTLGGEIVSLSNGNFIKLNINIQDLVEKPPDIIGNRMYIGEKYMRTYIVESDTGAILAYNEGTHTFKNPSDSQSLIIGLMDYVYKVFDINTMDMVWNITYTEMLSQSKTLSLNRSSFDLETAVKNYGSITALHHLSPSGMISHELAIPNQVNKVKLNSVGNNMLYAEILTENSDAKNVFSLEYENLPLLIDGKPEDQNFFYGALLIVLAVSGFYLFQSAPKAEVIIPQVQVPVIPQEIEQKRHIDVHLDKILGNGSQGTTVFEGLFQQRPVAVKRMLSNCIKEAKQEIALLIKADGHPNVVSFFAWEEDQTFVYLALEKCIGTLAEFVADFSKKKKKVGKFNIKKLSDPLKLLLDSSKGLSYLHKLNIAHRDIKPMNILIDSKGNAKIADMASGKRLAKDSSSFGTHSHGSSGWQPKEVLLNQRKTKSVDIFSLGCTFYYTLTKGQHPFGSRVQRDNNIISGTYLLSGISNESRHLIEKMIKQDPSARPTADYISQHCMFWGAQLKLNFLQDLSDLLEAEGNGSLLEIEIENYCKFVLKTPWNVVLGDEFMQNLGKYRKYEHNSVKDLLRVIRNKLHHYHDLTPSLQKAIGPVPEGFYSYFDKNFPLLFITLFDYVEKSRARIYTKYISI